MSLVVIFALALIPVLISLVLLRRIKRRWETRLRQIHRMTTYRVQVSRRPNLNEESAQLHDYFIGDLSCRYNARSPYLRCAVNPNGPCEECSQRQPRYGNAGDRDLKP